MIAIFMRRRSPGHPTRLTYYKVFIDPTKLTVFAIEGLPKAATGVWIGAPAHQLNKACLDGKSGLHLRFSFEGYYRRAFLPHELDHAVELPKRSLIRQFWIRPDGQRRMSLYPVTDDILDLPIPENLSEGIVRDGLPHLINNLCIPLDAPMRTLGLLSAPLM